ncbi:MAG: DUF1080 domain-containing protein [Bacteroidales bacterium]|nr:DUF1080 domain-containing protein [Bacteroidales bacterium]
MKRILALMGIAALILCACTPKENTLTPEEIADGWQLLFDGETLDGWHYFNGGDVDDGEWYVENGCLVASGKGSDSKGYIVTDELFGDFYLKWEWKISKGGNSGMMYHVIEDPDYSVPYITGPEYQIIDDVNYAEMNDGYILEPWQRCAVDYAMYVPDFDTSPILKPAGEWNQSEIIFYDGFVIYLLNGVETVSFEAWSDDWYERKAAGKWANSPDYGMASTGNFCLQDHGYPAWFRNIKVRPL